MMNTSNYVIVPFEYLKLGVDPSKLVKKTFKSDIIVQKLAFKTFKIQITAGGDFADRSFTNSPSYSLSLVTKISWIIPIYLNKVSSLKIMQNFLDFCSSPPNTQQSFYQFFLVRIAQTVWVILIPLIILYCKLNFPLVIPQLVFTQNID